MSLKEEAWLPVRMERTMLAQRVLLPFLAVAAAHLEHHHHQHHHSHIHNDHHVDKEPWNVLDDLQQKEQDLDEDNLGHGGCGHEAMQAMVEPVFTPQLHKVKNSGIKQSGVAADPLRIRLVEDSSLRCTSVGQVITWNIESCAAPSAYTCTAQDIVTDDELAAVRSHIEGATEFFSRILDLREPIEGPLVKWRSTLCNIPLPSTDTFDDTDLLVVWTTAPTISGIAWASHGEYDSSTGRAIVGVINFAAQYSSSFAADFGATALHELTHILAISSGLFSRWKLPDGTQHIDDVVLTQTARDHQVSYITTPAVVDTIQRHFACSELVGAELEDFGSSGTAGSHWDQRLVGSEIMGPSTKGKLSYVSDLTIAALYDTGWYDPVVDADVSGLIEGVSSISPMRFGRGKGCSFAQDKCSTWDPVDGYFCTQDVSASTIACTPERTAFGPCYLSTYTSPLPAYYQYFEDETRGGMYYYADYCPRHGPYTSAKCVDQDTSDYDSSTARTVYGFYIEEDSRCFTSTVLRSTFSSTNFYNVRCHQHECTADGILRIYIRSPTSYDDDSQRDAIDCPRDGGTVDVETVSSDWRGTIECPPAIDLCVQHQSTEDSPTSSKTQSHSLSTSPSRSSSQSASPSPSPSTRSSVALIDQLWFSGSNPIDLSTILNSRVNSVTGDIVVAFWVSRGGFGTILANKNAPDDLTPRLQVTIAANGQLLVFGTCTRGGISSIFVLATIFVPTEDAADGTALVFIGVRLEPSKGVITVSMFDEQTGDTATSTIDDLDEATDSFVLAYGPDTVTMLGAQPDTNSGPDGTSNHFTGDIRLATIYPLPDGYPGGAERPLPILQAQAIMTDQIIVEADRSDVTTVTGDQIAEFQGMEHASNTGDGVIAFSVCIKARRVAERYNFGYVFANHVDESTSDSTFALVSSHAGLQILFRGGCDLRRLDLSSLPLTSARIDDDLWHSVAVIVDGPSARVWIDGSLVSSISGFFPQGVASCPQGSTFVGRRQGSQFENYIFTGSVAGLTFFAFDPFDADGYAADPSDPSFYMCPVNPSGTPSVSPLPSPSPSMSARVLSPVELLTFGDATPADVSTDIQASTSEVTGDIIIAVWLDASTGVDGTLLVNQVSSDAVSPCLQLTAAGEQLFVVGTYESGSQTGPSDFFFTGVEIPFNGGGTDTLESFFVEVRVEKSAKILSFSITNDDTDVSESSTIDLAGDARGLCANTDSLTYVGASPTSGADETFQAIFSNGVIHVLTLYPLPPGYPGGSPPLTPSAK